MKILLKLAAALTLSTMSFKGICYAGKPQGCFGVQEYKSKQVFNEKKFVKEYLLRNLDFIRSPFFINQVLYIPFTQLSEIVDSPNVKIYFYSTMCRHSTAVKNNPLALIKFIVENQRIYGPIVHSYLCQNPGIVQKKSRDVRLSKLIKDLRHLLIGQQVLVNPQPTTASSIESAETSEMSCMDFMRFWLG